MLHNYFAVWKKSFDFTSRSSRKEYWYFNLLNFFLFILLRIIQGVLGNIVALNYEVTLGLSLVVLKTIEILRTLLILGSIWTSIPLTVRRIRDVGMSWKWIFLANLPILGGTFALIFLTRTSIQEIDGKKYYLKY